MWRTLGSKGSLQNDNITDALRPFISVNTQLDYSYDTNLVFGGPIRKNKLWFLLAQRVSRTNNLIAFPVGVLPGVSQRHPGRDRAASSSRTKPCA